MEEYICYIYILFIFFSIIVYLRILSIVPVLYGRTLLLIHSTCNSSYLLTKDSQSVPCLICLAATSLFSMFVSLFLFLFHSYVHLYHILDSTYK